MISFILVRLFSQKVKTIQRQRKKYPASDNTWIRSHLMFCLQELLAAFRFTYRCTIQHDTHHPGGDMLRKVSAAHIEVFFARAAKAHGDEGNNECI